jgi:SAM-dependent methyltransferase
MMWLIFGLILLLAAAFGGVLLVGAPYLPTLNKQVETALDLLDLKPGQTLLELGCGDGKVLLAAARHGLTVVGYELNPFLVLVARLRTWRYRRQVQVRWGNFWRANWPPADGVFVFLLDRFMSRLDEKLQSLHQPVRLVSFAFQIPGRQPFEQKDGLFLYIYGSSRPHKNKN